MEESIMHEEEDTPSRKVLGAALRPSCRGGGGGSVFPPGRLRLQPQQLSPNEGKPEPSLAATWTPAERGSLLVPGGCFPNIRAKSCKALQEEAGQTARDSWLLGMSTCNWPGHWLKAKKQQQQLAGEPWKEASGVMTLDDSLTNLQWLQEFSFLPADPQKAAGPPRLLQGSEAPASPPAGDTAATGMPAPHMGTPTSSSSSLQPLAPAQDTVDYRTNAQLKPPYSYATLICMAMQASREAKLTLAAIYTWITQNFCYYRHAEPSWQNSIRHNLSLNKCFKKVPRRKDEPGKGGFWQIDPQYADMFVNGVFRRRRMPALPPASSRAASAPEERTAGLRNRHHQLGQEEQPAAASSQAAWPGPPSPLTSARGEVVAAAAALPEDLAWASVLEDPFGGSLDDLELTTALGSLAAGEDLDAQSQVRAPSPATPLEEDDLTLGPESLPQPWEEGAAAEPTLGPAWALEEAVAAGFSEGFLAEIQPWEG